RTQPERIRQGNGSSDERPVTHIECCAAVVLRGIVGVRYELRCARAIAAEGRSESTTARTHRRDRHCLTGAKIAVSEGERIKTKQRNLAPQRVSHVGDQLVLFEDATGVVLI